MTFQLSPIPCRVSCRCSDTFILNQTTGAGHGGIFYGHGVPVGVQTDMDATIGNIYYDLDAAMRIYAWNVELQDWE